jgi:hypothetical protein
LGDLMSLFDLIVEFGAVAATAIAKETLDVTVQVLGIGGLADDQGDGESSPFQIQYGPLGLVSRALPPDSSSGTTKFAGVVCLKTSDGLVPIAWRDLRINAAFPAGPKAGTIALAGYGGGFYSLDLTGDNTNIHVIYCPYHYSGKTPGKAHAIIIDPSSGNECISITHGEGYQLSISKDNGFQVNIDSGTWMSMKPGSFTMNAAKIILQGNCVFGANAASAAPVLPSTATLASPSVFLSTS